MSTTAAPNGTAGGSPGGPGLAPPAAQLLGRLASRSNWGRWGADDERGALNLLTPGKRRAACHGVRSGRTFSLSRPLDESLGREEPYFDRFDHQVWTVDAPAGDGGVAGERYRCTFHGYDITHMDALCHLWGAAGMWNGRDPATAIADGTSSWADIDKWADGVVTRGVLFDVPRHRGVPYVRSGEPVHGDELEAVAAAQGVTLEPGDAVLVCCGRERWSAEHPDWSLGRRRPGLHASCLDFLRDHDVSVVVWDQADEVPNELGLFTTVHNALWAFGTALVDNALLEPLAEACAEESRAEVLLVVAPLRIVGGSGCPVNPLAVL